MITVYRTSVCNNLTLTDNFHLRLTTLQNTGRQSTVNSRPLDKQINRIAGAGWDEFYLLNSSSCRVLVRNLLPCICIDDVQFLAQCKHVIIFSLIFHRLDPVYTYTRSSHNNMFYDTNNLSGIRNTVPHNHLPSDIPITCSSPPLDVEGIVAGQECQC